MEVSEDKLGNLLLSCFYCRSYHLLLLWSLLLYPISYFKSMRIDFLGSMDNWVEIIPHREDTHILTVDPFANHLVLTERRNGQVNIRVIDHTKNTYVNKTKIFCFFVFLFG